MVFCVEPYPMVGCHSFERLFFCKRRWRRRWLTAISQTAILKPASPILNTSVFRHFKHTHFIHPPGAFVTRNTNTIFLLFLHLYNTLDHSHFYFYTTPFFWSPTEKVIHWVGQSLYETDEITLAKFYYIDRRLLKPLVLTLLRDVCNTAAT